MNQLSRFCGAWVVAIAALVALPACDANRETPATNAGRAASPGAAGDTSLSRSVGTPARVCGGTTITGAGLGDLRIGMSVASVHSVCRVVGDATRLASEGQTARFLAVEFPRDTVDAEVVDGEVWRIEVVSPSFRTADSLGVGTPLSRLLELRDARGITGEGQLFVISPVHCGLSFRLSDNGSSARSQKWDRAGLSRLPSGTVVNKVLIVGCERR